jgi:hypothetical protein
LLAPASDVIDGITFIGFVGFFVWMAAMGVSLLLGQRAAASKMPAPASPRGARKTLPLGTGVA